MSLHTGPTPQSLPGGAPGVALGKQKLSATI